MLKLIFRIFIPLFFALRATAEVTVSAPQFNEAEVVKQVSVKRVVPKDVLKHPEPGKVWTHLEFEFLILKDSSLWVRPLLPAGEEKVHFGPLEIDRSVPHHIPVTGFTPVEFAKVGEQAYLVVNNEGTSDKYLVELKPTIGRKPNLLRALLQPEDSKARLSSELTFVTNLLGVPLAIQRYKFQRDKTLADIQLKDVEGNLYWLRSSRDLLKCKESLESSAPTTEGVEITTPEAIEDVPVDGDSTPEGNG